MSCRIYVTRVYYAPLAMRKMCNVYGFQVHSTLDTQGKQTLVSLRFSCYCMRHSRQATAIKHVASLKHLTGFRVRRTFIQLFVSTYILRTMHDSYRWVSLPIFIFDISLNESSLDFVYAVLIRNVWTGKNYSMKCFSGRWFQTTFSRLMLLRKIV